MLPHGKQIVDCCADLCSTAAPSPSHTFCPNPSACEPSRCSRRPEATSPATGRPRGSYPPGTALTERGRVTSPYDTRQHETGRASPRRTASPGCCGALYRSSCRKGSELTRPGAPDGWKNSLATKSPDVLLSWKSRGVKWKFPGSEEQNQKPSFDDILILETRYVLILLLFRC